MKFKVKNKTPITRWIAGVKLPQGVEKEIDLNKKQAEHVTNSYKFSAAKVVEENIEEPEEESEEEEDEEFVCDECGEAFDSERGRKLHKTKSH